MNKTTIGCVWVDDGKAANFQEKSEAGGFGYRHALVAIDGYLSARS
ncbi:MAG: hypothetical protein WA510_15940 [Acidobacteriaceae bacterium]